MFEIESLGKEYKILIFKNVSSNAWIGFGAGNERIPQARIIENQTIPTIPALNKERIEAN